jgi:hypothetical protein
MVEPLRAVLTSHEASIDKLMTADPEKRAKAQDFLHSPTEIPALPQGTALRTVIQRLGIPWQI